MNDPTKDTLLLHAYFDGELDAAERAAFEERLAAEPALAARLDALRAADGALGLLPLAAPATDFARAVEADAALDLLPEASPSPAFTAEAVAGAELDRALDLLPAAGPADGFVERVVARARREGRGRLLRLAGTAAAAAALVAVAVLLRSGEPAPAPTEGAFTPYEWETDGETYPSMALQELEDEILEELGAT